MIHKVLAFIMPIIKHSFDFLEQLCLSSQVVDARSKLEAQAYAHWISGTLAFELGQWSDAMKALNSAKAIYVSGIQ